MRCFFAALTGAVVVFAWGMVSWMFLPWHNWDMKSFNQDGQAIVEALQKEASGSGIYVIPNMDPAMHDNPEKQKTWLDKAHKGPFAYMNVKMEGTNMHADMKTSLAIQFLLNFIVAAISTCLLGCTTLNALWKKGLFISFLVTSGTFLSEASNWNWWSFPTNMTLVNIADVAIAWLLGGLAIGLIAKRCEKPGL